MSLFLRHLRILLLPLALAPCDSCSDAEPEIPGQCESGLSPDPATGLCARFESLTETVATSPRHLTTISTQATTSLTYDPVWGRYLLGTGQAASDLVWTVPLVREPAATQDPVFSMAEGGPSDYSLLLESAPGKLRLLTGTPHNWASKELPARTPPLLGAWHAYDAQGGAQFVAADGQGRLFWTQTVQGSIVDWTQVVDPAHPTWVPVAPASLFAVGGRLELATAVRPNGLLVMHRGTETAWETSVLAEEDRVTQLAAAGRGENGVLVWLDCLSGALRFASAEGTQVVIETLDSQAINPGCSSPPTGGFGLLALPQSSTVLVAYYRAAQGSVRLVEVRPGSETQILSDTTVPGPLRPAIGFTSEGRIIAAGVLTSPGATRGLYTSITLY